MVAPADAAIIPLDDFGSASAGTPVAAPSLPNAVRGWVLGK